MKSAHFSRSWQGALQQAGITNDVAAYAAEAVRGGVPLVQLASTPGFELGVETAPVFRLATAFDELQLAI